MANKPSARILVVEDEKNVGSTLVDRLVQEGFEVQWAKTAEAARLEISGRRFDLALLDIGLPDGSGLEIAKELRAKDRSTALIFLTAFGSSEDRIKGLELGAEDYIVKPFHLKELLLRIQNGLKRARYLSVSDHPDEIQIGEALVRFHRFELISQGRAHTLGHKECALLRLLWERRGKTVSREEILSEIWPEDEFPSTRTVDNFMVRLRRWIEKDPENPAVIRSVRGVGYQLEIA